MKPLSPYRLSRKARDYYGHDVQRFAFECEEAPQRAKRDDPHVFGLPGVYVIRQLTMGGRWCSRHCMGCP